MTSLKRLFFGQRLSLQEQAKTARRTAEMRAKLIATQNRLSALIDGIMKQREKDDSVKH
jgi:hypothetical protein